MLPARVVTVAERADSVVGFLALGEGQIDALYIADGARRRGVGASLIGDAKAMRPTGLMLWTFVANDAARAFYAAQGFAELRRTEGDNEERLPDILLYWPGVT